MLNFPDAPVVNQTYTDGTTAWKWDGAKWVTTLLFTDAPSDSSTYGRRNAAWNKVLPLTGGTLTGDLTVNALNLIVGTSTTAGANLTLNSVSPPSSNLDAGIKLQSAGRNRWWVHLNGIEGGGANFGSNFVINRHDDAGVWLDSPLVISRWSGIVSFTASPTGPTPAAGDSSTKFATTAFVATKAGAYLPLVGGTLTGNLTLGTSTATSTLTLNGPAGSTRQFLYQTAGSLRWLVAATSTGEAAGNVGSDYAIGRCDNTGTYIDLPLTIARSTGNVSLAHSLTVTGQATLAGVIADTLSLVGNLGGGTPPGGNVAMGWNYASGSGEFDFFNNYQAAATAFSFWQKTGATTFAQIMLLSATGNLSITGGLTAPGGATISGGAQWSAFNSSQALIVTTPGRNPTIGIGDSNSTNFIGLINSAGDFSIAAMPALADTTTPAVAMLSLTRQGSLTVAGNIQGTVANGGLELGAKGTANTPFIDLNSSGSNNDYDVRLLASGGGAGNGTGSLNITASGSRLTDSSGALAALTVANTVSANGAAIQITGPGATTPSKYMRAMNGRWEVINSAYSAVLLSLTDQGRLLVGLNTVDDAFSTLRVEGPASGWSLNRLQVHNTNTGTGTAGIDFNVASGAENQAGSPKAGIGLQRASTNGVGDVIFYNRGTVDNVAYNSADARMRVRPDGVTVIGTLIVNELNGRNMQLVGGAGSTAPNKWIRAYGDCFEVVNNGYAAVPLSLTDAGNLTILGATATKPGGGSWAAPSDERIKTVHGAYEQGLDAICALQPVRYSYLGNATLTAPPEDEDETPQPKRYLAPEDEGGTERIGLIAQAVEGTFPECVTATLGYIDGEEVDDLRHLDTSPMLFALCNAVRELRDRVVELEAR